MNTSDMVGWFIILAPVLTTAGGLIGAALVKNWKPARDVAFYVADYHQAVEDAVTYAERYGLTNNLPGFEKLAVATHRMEEWFDEMGIEGNAKAITMARLRSDIELAVAAARRAATGRTTP